MFTHMTDHMSGDIEEMKTAELSKLPKLAYALVVAAFLVGILLGAGYASRGTSATVTETMQVPTTYTSLTTVTEGANVADYKAAMKTIISQLSDMSSSTSAQVTAASNGQISQAELLAFITTQKDKVGVLLESTIRLHPPQAFAEAHVHVVRAIALLYSAYQLTEDGLTQNNPALITEASTFLNQSNNEIETATSILNSQ
jgi:hypothetical protein